MSSATEARWITLPSMINGKGRRSSGHMRRRRRGASTPRMDRLGLPAVLMVTLIMLARAEVMEGRSMRVEPGLETSTNVSLLPARRPGTLPPQALQQP